MFHASEAIHNGDNSGDTVEILMSVLMCSYMSCHTWRSCYLLNPFCPVCLYYITFVCAVCRRLQV